MGQSNPVMRNTVVSLDDPADTVYVPGKNGGSKKLRVSAVPESMWSDHPDTATDSENVPGLRQFHPRNSSLVIIQNKDEPSRFIVVADWQVEAFCKSFLRRRGFTVTEPVSGRERT